MCRYLFEVILGKEYLPNVYIAVSNSGDAVTTPAVQQEWVAKSRANKMFAKMVQRIGEDKIIFVDIPRPSLDADDERRKEGKRRRSRDAVLLLLARAQHPPRFEISALEEARRAFYRQMEQATQEAVDLVNMATKWKKEAEKKANVEKQCLLIEKAKIEKASDQQVEELNKAIESLGERYKLMLEYLEEMTRIATQRVSKREHKVLDLLSKLAITVTQSPLETMIGFVF